MRKERGGSCKESKERRGGRSDEEEGAQGGRKEQRGGRSNDKEGAISKKPAANVTDLVSASPECN